MEFICRQCSKMACPFVNEEDRRAIVECQSFIRRVLVKELPEPLDIPKIVPEIIETLDRMTDELLAKAEVDGDEFNKMADAAIEAKDNMELLKKLIGENMEREFQEEEM